MATDYPIEITDPDGSVRIAGLADFTDPDNQPAGAPLVVPQSGVTVLVTDPSDDDLFDYDGDASQFNFGGLQAVAFNGNMGFFSTAPVEQPQVPATPLPQDIVDALVALGLVSQAS